MGFSAWDPDSLAVFEAVPKALLLLSTEPDFTIIGVNPACLA
jgi:hypothetical protein